MTEFPAPGVFINCPFDPAYRPLFEAIVFAVFDCGCRPRCSLEADDAGEVRFEKIVKIIGQCRFGIHDLSRTELDDATALPRFNMPLELGLFLGARRFGSRDQKRKVCLVLDCEPYRYQMCLSDIAGQDVRSHGGDPAQAIRQVRDWLRTARGGTLAGGVEIASRYEQFRRGLPDLCSRLRLKPPDLTYADLINLIEQSLRQAPLAQGAVGEGESA